VSTTYILTKIATSLPWLCVCNRYGLFFFRGVLFVLCEDFAIKPQSPDLSQGGACTYLQETMTPESRGFERHVTIIKLIHVLGYVLADTLLCEMLAVLVSHKLLMDCCRTISMELSEPQ
jgi:hypothetical protein